MRVTTAPISLSVLLSGQMAYVSKHGFRVTMVCSNGPELKSVLEREMCSHWIVPMTRRLSPFQDFICLWKLFWLILREKPDIIHSHTPKAGLLAMLAGKIAGVRHRVHTVAGLRYVSETGFRRELLKLMERLTLSCATHVWINGKSLKRKLLQVGLVSSTKLDMVGLGSSNGVDLNRFSISKLSPETLQKVIHSISYTQECKYIVCIGRIVEDKGINELIQVFDELFITFSDLRLILVGDYENDIDPISPQSLSKIKSNSSIIVTGWTENVSYYMSLATFLIHPSHREGFPNVLLQAGAMRCPVVCSDIDGNLDIVTNEITGLVFRVKDPISLKAVVIKALTSPQEMKAYSDNLHKHVVNNFEQNAYWNLLLQKYNSLLAVS